MFLGVKCDHRRRKMESQQRAHTSHQSLHSTSPDMEEATLQRGWGTGRSTSDRAGSSLLYISPGCCSLLYLLVAFDMCVPHRTFGAAWLEAWVSTLLYFLRPELIGQRWRWHTGLSLSLVHCQLCQDGPPCASCCSLYAYVHIGIPLFIMTLYFSGMVGGFAWGIVPLRIHSPGVWCCCCSQSTGWLRSNE